MLVFIIKTSFLSIIFKFLFWFEDTTIAYNENFKKWYEFNDSFVVEIDETKICVIFLIHFLSQENVLVSILSNIFLSRKMRFI